MTLLADSGTPLRPEGDDREDFDRLMNEYREARDEEDDAASRASSLSNEIDERWGISAEGER